MSPPLLPLNLCTYHVFNFFHLFVPSIYQYTTFLLSICKLTTNEPLDSRTKRKVANLISQNWVTGWELSVKTTPRVPPINDIRKSLSLSSVTLWFRSLLFSRYFRMELSVFYIHIQRLNERHIDCKLAN